MVTLTDNQKPDPIAERLRMFNDVQVYYPLWADIDGELWVKRDANSMWVVYGALQTEGRDVADGT